MIRNILQGALAGLTATIPMTEAMRFGHRRLAWWERYRLPPRQITMRIANKAGLSKYLDGNEPKAITLLAHFGYGAAMGALYGATAPRKEAVPSGLLCGMLVWAGSYLGLLPALGILKPATQHPARRNVLMIAAHLIWGTSLALLFRGMQPAEQQVDYR